LTRVARAALAFGASLLAFAPVAAHAVGPINVPTTGTGAGTGSTLDRTLTDPRIDEASGLVVSTLHPGVDYTHNDSGDGPRLFAVGRDGRTRAVLTLRGAPARDWEAISPGRAGTHAIWIGDIGDNLASWPSIRVYRIDEPRTLRTKNVAWTQYDLRFPDGSHDAESLLVDPRTGRLFIASKKVEGAALYEAPAVLSTTHVNVLHRVASAMPLATDGAFSPDARYYVLRGYIDAVVYDAARPGHVVTTIDLPPQPQGEGVAWSPDGRSLLVGSEGNDSAIYRVALPASVTGIAATASPTRASSPSPTTGQIAPTGSDTSNADSSGLPRRQLYWLAAAALVLIVLGWSLRSWAKRDEPES